MFTVDGMDGMFPTPVGMNRHDPGAAQRPADVPHTSGDEPLSTGERWPGL